METRLARVVELVDTRDLKSLDRNIVPVQVRPRVPHIMIKVNVTNIVHWSDRTFSIKTTRDESFRFESGEFAMIGMMSDKYKKNVIRAYSVVSPPWAENLEFLSIKNVGPLTNELSNVKLGDELVLLPKTTGTLRNAFLTPGGKRLLLLATGTGLAPFMSTIRDLDIIESFDTIHLVHSARHRDDLAYNKELTTIFEDEPDIHELLKRQIDIHSTSHWRG